MWSIYAPCPQNFYDYGSIQVYCASSVKVMPVPQAISQLFATLHSRILEVIYKPLDRALSVHVADRLRSRLYHSIGNRQ